MQKILTLEETQRRHKELWTWLAKETRKRKGNVEKNEFFDISKANELPIHSCWCCEFAREAKTLLKNHEHYRCTLCPLKDKEICEESFCKCRAFNDWLLCTDWQKAADLAEQIANLPFKKAFDITPEQAKMLRDKGYGEIYSIYEKER